MAEDQQETYDPCVLLSSAAKPPVFTLNDSDNPIAEKYIINNANDNNGDVQISYDVTAENPYPFLLITTFLCNSAGQLINAIIDTNHMLLIRHN